MIDGMIAGLVSGSAYAVLGVGVVVLSRLVGVVGFALGALGALGAYTAYALLPGLGAGTVVGVLLAVTAGLAVAAAVAGGAGWVLAHFFPDPSQTVRTVVSVVLLLVLLALGFRLFGDTPRSMPSLVPDVSFAVGGVRVSLTTAVAVAAAVCVAAALTLVLGRTRIGTRLEAMAERPTALARLGVNTRALAVGVWATMGVLATLAMLLIAPTRTPTFLSMSLLIVPALAAALLGAFGNVWVALVGGLAIGALEGAGARIPGIADYRGALPFVIILLALICLRRREVWGASR